MIPTYDGVLSAIEKALWELMEYWRVGKSLWDLVESQKRNMAQLEKIEAVIEWRWGKKKERKKEENEDEEGDLRMALGKVRRRGLYCLSSARIVVLYLF